MTDRPPVPAELRRRILVEAGHRCAIHTCKHPEVDVHHITPWEKCRSHDYDNLIALCPNCHRRADAGEIDRNSLRLYKARLVASFGLYELLSPGRTVDSQGVLLPSTREWRTEVLREKQEDPAYEAELEFPSFTSNANDLMDLALLERSRAIQSLNKLRALRLTVRSYDDDPLVKMPGTVSSSYEVSCFTKDIVSIRYSVFHYGPGAAHPNHWTEVTNVQLGPLIALQFVDMFNPESEYLRTISEYCISSLTEDKGLSEPSGMIRTGAAPEARNFKCFNITTGGLMITFDEYQVDCYAAGASQVHIASTLISGYLNPKCLVNRVWQTAQACNTG